MKKIELRNYKDFLENIIFIFSLLTAYILQTSCNIKYNITPLIIISIVISISMFQNIVISCVYSLIAGILCDVSMNTPIGLSSVIFIVVCALISMLTIYFFKINLNSFMIFTFILLLIEYIFIIVFKYKSVSFSDLYILVVRNVMPSILFTVIISPLIFLLFSYVNNKLLYNNDIFF